MRVGFVLFPGGGRIRVAVDHAGGHVGRFLFDVHEGRWRGPLVRGQVQGVHVASTDTSAHSGAPDPYPSATTQEAHVANRRAIPCVGRIVTGHMTSCRRCARYHVICIMRRGATSDDPPRNAATVASSSSMHCQWHCRGRQGGTC